MPIYNNQKKVLSGVPLGGIGAGKMEILPNGIFSGFTFLNNWSSPLKGNDKFPGILGYHLALYAQPIMPTQAQSKTYLLQTEPLAHWDTVESIQYDGKFPLVRLKYKVPSLPIEIYLESWSGWIPGNEKLSSMPGVYFKIFVKNNAKVNYRVGLLFIGRNLCGDWCVGRANSIKSDSKFVFMKFSNLKAAPEDPRKGEILFSFKKKDWQTTYLETWNAVTKNFHFDPKEVRLAALEVFSKDGRLPNTSTGYVAQGENRELCGAVSGFKIFKPGESSDWNFHCSWYFPGHVFGHSYAADHKDVESVQRDSEKKRVLIRKKVDKLHSLVKEMPFPEWFHDALLNTLAPFFSSSWYTRDGRFAFYEAPVVCPLMGTLDVGFYGSIPLSYFFPRLEISQISQFAKAQRKDGYVPHDLGRNRIDIPSNGTTFFFWKDLNPKFILMAYRDVLWSGDKVFLKKIYPHVKKALEWCFAHDVDGNGLPDHEGADQTFDLWDFKGANSYTASLYLAALLASIRMANELGDKRFSEMCQRMFVKGRSAFESELWNGEYFGQTCALSQLNGQWYADLLNLGDIADASKIRISLESILRNNSKHSKYGLVNSVLSDRNLDISNPHAKNIWFGMNYAFISLALMRGFSLKKVLKPAYELWENAVNRQKNPWDQPDMIDSKTGQYSFGDAYYRNMAIWAIPIAYAKRDKKTAGILSKLRKI